MPEFWSDQYMLKKWIFSEFWMDKATEPKTIDESSDDNTAVSSDGGGFGGEAMLQVKWVVIFCFAEKELLSGSSTTQRQHDKHRPLMLTDHVP